MNIKWSYKTFDNLSNSELYNILRLRSEVFIIEQQCIYQDLDGKDLKSHHLTAWDGDNLVAYTRIVPPGVSFPEVSIGRVLTSPLYRGNGKGIALMQKSIEKVYETYGKTPIRIGAQLYLKKFYENLGFAKDSDQYLEDGIPHIEMILA